MTVRFPVKFQFSRILNSKNNLSSMYYVPGIKKDKQMGTI